MSADLAQPREGCQDVNSGPLGWNIVPALKDFTARRLRDRSIEFALQRRQVDDQLRFRALRKLRGDVFFGTPQDKRFETRAQSRRRFLIACRNGSLKTPPEGAFSSK